MAAVEHKCFECGGHVTVSDGSSLCATQSTRLCIEWISKDRFACSKFKGVEPDGGARIEQDTD